MTILDLSALPLEQKVLVGKVIIQVMQELRFSVANGVTLDQIALHKYEGLKFESLNFQALGEERPRSEQAEGSKR